MSAWSGGCCKKKERAMFRTFRYAFVFSMILMVAGVAAALPAWRASRLDPVAALREE